MLDSVILHIAPLPVGITATDLSARFSAFGEVLDVRGVGTIEGNGLARRYAHVVMRLPREKGKRGSPAEAADKFSEKVCRILTGTRWKGETIRVCKGRAAWSAKDLRQAHAVAQPARRCALPKKGSSKIIYRFREPIRPASIARSIRAHGERRPSRKKNAPSDPRKAPETLFGGEDEPGLIMQRAPKGTWLKGCGRLLTFDARRYPGRSHIKWNEEGTNIELMRLSGGHYDEGEDEDEDDDGDQDQDQDEVEDDASGSTSMANDMPNTQRADQSPSKLSGMFAPKAQEEAPFTLFGPPAIEETEAIDEPKYPLSSASITPKATAISIPASTSLSSKTNWPLFFPHDEPHLAHMTMTSAISALVMTCPLPDPTAPQYARPVMGRQGRREAQQATTSSSRGGLPDFLTGSNADTLSRPTPSSSSLRSHWTPASAARFKLRQEQFYGTALRDPEVCVRRWKERKRNLTLGFKKLHRETARRKGKRHDPDPI